MAYVKNDHLDFTIPYEWEHEVHSYYPDFIIRLKLRDDSEINVILEVKGYESEKDRAKKPAAEVDFCRESPRRLRQVDSKGVQEPLSTAEDS